jgi:hypothetical protein
MRQAWVRSVSKLALGCAASACAAIAMVSLESGMVSPGVKVKKDGAGNAVSCKMFSIERLVLMTGDYFGQKRCLTQKDYLRQLVNHFH